MDPSTSPQVRTMAKDNTEENDPNKSPTLKERRLKYKCGEKFVTLDNIPSWTEYPNKYLSTSGSPKIGNFTVNEDLNNKLSLWQGDITALEIDAIVNAANSSLLGGGGVDGAIHSAAGPKLREFCLSLNGCETGEAKISPGFNLPAKFIIHTVGPIGENEAKLHSCYYTSLTRLKENKLRTVAFPCVSTGIYGYPNKEATQVALKAVRNWLEKDNNSELVDRIIFCLFLKIDVELYHHYLPLYFPFEPTESDNSSSDGSLTKIVSDGSSQTVSK